MKPINIFLIFVLMLFVIPIVSAVAPNTLSSTVTIQTVEEDTHSFNQSMLLHIHAYATETGIPVPNTTLCYYDLYYKNGVLDEIAEGGIPYYELGSYEVLINESNFTKYGTYSVIFRCSTATYGGFYQYYFTIDNDAEKIGIWTCPDKTKIWLPIFILSLGIIAVLTALMMGESIFGILGGVLIFASYFFIGACAPLILSIIMFIGIIITIRFAFI